MRWAPCVGALVACLTGVAGPACGQSAQHAGTAGEAALDSAVAEALARDGIPGLAVAVVRDGRVAVTRGYGVTRRGDSDAVSDRTLFQLGSVTKMATALLIATLAERGRLSLDSPVGTYLPGLPEWEARLTLHQLLSQTAGLRDAPADSGAHDEAALLEFVRGWDSGYQLLPPGTAFSYSNPGYALAGAVAAVRVGMPFADLASARLLQPLGMSTATFRPADVRERAHAIGHAGPRGTPAAPLGPAADDARFWPAGYLFASARDLARLLLVLLNEGVADGHRVIPGAAVRRVLAPAVTIPVDLSAAHYGYGLILQVREGVRTAWHDGAMPGFTAQILLEPDRKAGVVVMANREGVSLERLTRAALGGGQVPGEDAATATVPATDVPPAEAQALAGRYENRWPFVLALQGDTLVLRRFGQTLAVRRAGVDRYVALAANGHADEFLIVRDAHGTPACLLMYVWAFCRESPGGAPRSQF